ncbi:O-antigen ligase family protein [Cobetia sp. cqz5-12]|uniref:O-antigen ligase family protein n=1 Tax=Cobetia sp. cqz5-12 TaxID=2609415 RepID=UPI0019036F02|nr:O-antigen ligase family protein [Cobetia sp. cqz5-12]
MALIFGQITPHDRMTLYSFPLNTVYMLIVVTLVVVTGKFAVNLPILYLFLVFFIWGMTLLYSVDLEYGSFKLLNLVFVYTLCVGYLYSQMRSKGLDEVLKYFVTCFIILAIPSILYKIIFGFFDRNIPFFINGPIVFARLMSLGLLFSLFMYKESKNVHLLFFSFFFLLAIFWTESKAPIGIALLMGLFTVFDFKKIRTYAIFLVIFLMAVYMYEWGISRIDTLAEIPGLSRIIIGVGQITGDISMNDYSSGSVSSRIDNVNTSLSMIYENPLTGVGLGSWGDYNLINELVYPHNIFLEIASETGLVGFFPFAFILGIAFIYGRGILLTAWLTLLFNQLFSGDLLDARFLFIFMILSLYNNKDARSV